MISKLYNRLFKKKAVGYQKDPIVFVGHQPISVTWGRDSVPTSSKSTAMRRSEAEMRRDVYLEDGRYYFTAKGRKQLAR